MTRRSYGLLHVYKYPGKTSVSEYRGSREVSVKLSDIYYFAYAGQMGTRIETIRECFEALYGEDSWERFKKLARIHQKDLTYMWTASVPIKEFEAEFGS